ncbi:glycosyltransferase family 2 protein [Celeribacter indicus]|uniref:Glycosyl transferase family 2 n=1 Tax=Celeribacter indicus TaxID=1208324 RepID=A0A0B5E6F1_9RHOB|nr:glycosyltransferase family 2 protein [Celeribacter indicus]AJE48586.1 hypothetical protein P73_3871 [Celeribacter indicus]SDX09075.1 Glycosyl transferase family 2 [Celeribacter indicus]
MTSSPTWAVVALVDEPAPLVAAFARHHLALGASEVHLFLDRPDPEADRLLSGLSGCRLTVLDQAFWDATNRGRRPERHTGRQRFVSTRIYRQTSCDWLLHCDADEFVSDRAALSAALASADRSKGLVLRNRERVYLAGDPGMHLFGGAFRTPVDFPDADAAAVYGDFARYLAHGLTGHRVGKTIVPTGHDWEMGVHHPKLPGPDRITPDLARAPGRMLLHFDGLTPLHYALKLLRKAFENYSGPKRQIGAARERQYRFVRSHAGQPEEVMALVRGVQQLDARQAAMLDALGVLDTAPFRPRDCDGLDLGRTGFDALLRHREAALFRTAGFDM